MSDDLISRQAAVSRFSDLLMLELEGKRLPTWEEVYNAMQDLPSAEPEPCDFCVYNRDCGDMRLYCPARGRTDA